MTIVPGIRVNTAAAASPPQSMPEALMVLVMMAAMGLALTAVNVLAKSNSTQLNMKQKNAVTPIPALIRGTKMVTKNRVKP